MYFYHLCEIFLLFMVRTLAGPDNQMPRMAQCNQIHWFCSTK